MRLKEEAGQKAELQKAYAKPACSEIRWTTPDMQRTTPLGTNAQLWRDDTETKLTSLELQGLGFRFRDYEQASELGFMVRV